MLISTIEIKAEKKKVWEILLDKVLQPDRYIPGIIEFECKERDENEYIRTLYTETDDVVELIIVQEENYTILSTLVRHAFLKGKLIQHLEEKEDGCVLFLEQEREITLDQLKGLDMQPALDAAALQIKQIAEED